MRFIMFFEYTRYAVSKGVPARGVRAAVATMMKMIDLSDKRTTLSKDLSGGMKRKLCVGIAIIGGSKICFLDEPTSGIISVITAVPYTSKSCTVYGVLFS